MHLNKSILSIIIGMFYFTLGNLSPKFRSKLASINLLAIVKTKCLSSYGMDKVLRPFIEDLKKLVTILSHVHV